MASSIEPGGDELAASNRRFRAVLDGMSEALFLFEAVREDDAIVEFQLVDANRIALSWLRRTREEAIGKLYSEIWGRARDSGLLDRFAQVLLTGEPYDADVEVKDTAIDASWVHYHAVPCANGVAVTCAEITERRALRRERQLHTAVVKNMSEGLCLVRADGIILFTNQKLDQMLGYAAGELKGTSYALAHVDEVRARGEARYEMQHVRKDGREIQCRATASIIRDEDGAEVFVIVTADITDEKRLKEERDGFFLLSSDMLAVSGFDGYFKQLNPAWTTTLGWSLEELLTRPWLDLVHPDDRVATSVEGATLTSGLETVTFVNRYMAKDGTYRALQWRSVPSRHHGMIFAVARDITEQRRAVEAMKASLAEKEILLQEIHHRVKNNLQVISSLFKLHAERITDPAARSAFQDGQDRVRSIALLHEKLYQSKDLGSVSAGDYAESLVHALLRAHGDLAAADVVVEATDVALPIDLAVPCGLILNELVTNALKHAFPSPRDKPGHVVVAMTSDADCFVLTVTDDGVGLRADFDHASAGTLGMHLVRTLGRQLCAQVTVRGDRGTRWTFRFPKDPETDT